MLTQKRGARKKHRVFRRLQAEDELHARVEANSLKKVEGIVIWDSGPFCCFSAQIGSVPRTPICKGLTNFLKQALFPSVRAAGAPGEVWFRLVVVQKHADPLDVVIARLEIKLIFAWPE